MEEKLPERRRRFSPVGFIVVCLVLLFWFVIVFVSGGCVSRTGVKESKLSLEFSINDGTSGYESTALENPVVEMQEGFGDLQDVLDGYDPDWSSQNLNGVFDVYGFDGDSVRIAVLDGGFKFHEDLDLSNLVDSWSFVWNREDVFGEGSFEHGLSVMSVIGAIAGNGKYMAGVPVEWCLYEIAWGSSAFVSESSLAAAIRRAVGHEVDVIVMAWGGWGWSGILASALREAYDAGVILVASSGNDGKLLYPAGWDTVIAVGASDMDQASPGGCYLRGRTRVLSSGGSREGVGTSFAAPAAGLLLGFHEFEDVYSWYRLSGYDPSKIDDVGLILAIEDEYGTEVYRVDDVNVGDIYRYREGWTVWVLVDRDRDGVMSVGDILGSGPAGSTVNMRSVWRIDR